MGLAFEQLLASPLTHAPRRGPKVIYGIASIIVMAMVQVAWQLGYERGGRLLSDARSGCPSCWFTSWAGISASQLLGTTAGFGRFAVLVLLRPDGRPTHAAWG